MRICPLHTPATTEERAYRIFAGNDPSRSSPSFRRYPGWDEALEWPTFEGSGQLVTNEEISQGSFCLGQGGRLQG